MIDLSLEERGGSVSLPTSLPTSILHGLVTLSLTIGGQSVYAADQDEQLANWHQWRGPLATGEAPRADPPLQWDSETNVQWKTAIPGRGSGTPIIWGDRLFVTTAAPTQTATGSTDRPAYDFMVICLDRHSGDVVWQKTSISIVPHEQLHPTNTYASASPTTNGEHLYVSFGSYGIYCYDLDGNPVWSRDLGDMQTRREFGEGASPTLHEDSLVVTWDHEGPSFITVLDAHTGDTRWKTDRDEVTTWNTPLVVEATGRTQVIVNATNRARSYDLETGEPIWECGGQVTNCIPSPLKLGDVVYCMSGYRGAALYAIPLDSHGDVTDSASLAWSRREGTPYVPSPLLYDRRLYFTKGNNGIVSCLDAVTGEPLIDQQRLPGVSNIYSSPVGAAGKVYITGRDGTTVVLEHADKLKVLATNQLGEPVDASPAAVGNQLFLRSESHLYCLSED